MLNYFIFIKSWMLENAFSDEGIVVMSIISYFIATGIVVSGLISLLSWSWLPVLSTILFIDSVAFVILIFFAVTSAILYISSKGS